MPLLVLLLATAVDLGRGISAAIATTSAAHAGALYGVQHPTDVAGMNAAATLDATSLPSLTPLASFGCECSDGSGAVANCTSTPTCAFNSVYYVELDTSAVYKPMLPYPGLPSSFTLHGKVRMRAAQ
jgi:Flp pilus assembly protein TadG